MCNFKKIIVKKQGKFKLYQDFYIPVSALCCKLEVFLFWKSTLTVAGNT